MITNVTITYQPFYQSDHYKEKGPTATFANIPHLHPQPAIVLPVTISPLVRSVSCCCFCGSIVLRFVLKTSDYYCVVTAEH
jgi:hypothetical protein